MSNGDHPTPTDPAAARDVARSCVAHWRQMPTRLRVQGGRDNVFRIGLPLAAHALNACDVALEVWGRVPLVALATTRVALEHAVAAQWVLLSKGGPEQLMKHMQYDNLKRAKAFAVALGKAPELLEGLDAASRAAFDGLSRSEAAPGNERQWKMEMVFDRFDPTGFFYDTYRELSAGVHPSLGTLTAHLDIDPAGNPPKTFRLGERARGSEDGFSTGVALASLLALDFIEECLQPDEWVPVAGSLAAGVSLPHNLAASDQAPEKQP